MTSPVASYTLHRGHAPLLLSLPHNGTALPEGLLGQLQPSARRLPDTDWHVARLYAFARELGASILVPAYSRYVIDLNRGQDDVSLYPGQNTTGLCPTAQFSGEPVYLPGQEPDQNAIRARVDRYWRPYHVALREELDHMRAKHARVVLWEGHSIKGELPFLFDGRLPDLNLGTVNGASCSPRLQAALEAILAAQNQYGFVANGRFKGGHITRHYGDPSNGIDAVQLEISQRCYMDEASFEWAQERATQLQLFLRRLLQSALTHAAHY